MRRDKVPLDEVERCAANPEVIHESYGARQNRWVAFGERFLRVTIVEEPDRTVVVSVVVKKRLPS